MLLGMPAAHAAGASGLSLLTNPTATGQAGYLASAPASASVSATFKVPAVTGCGSTQTGVAPAVIVFTSTNIAAAAGVFVECSGTGTTATYAGELLVGGKGVVTSFVPKAGDTIHVSVSSSATATKATLKDVTQGLSKSISGTGATNADDFAGMDTVDVTSGTTTTQLPVPNFGKDKFSAGKMDGTTVKGAAAVAYNLKSGSDIQIATGALNATGNGWAEIFKAST
jgi:hypothetical protein